MRALVAGLGLILLLTAPAWAEEEAASPPARRAVVVLDRGAAARAGAATNASNALRIWASLAKHGLDCTLVAAGVDGDGSTLVDDVAPTKPGLAGLSRRPVFDFRGATDPRAVLAHVLGAAEEPEADAPTTGAGPVDVILLGAFGPVSKDDDSTLAAMVTRWNESAPEGSRVLAVRMDPKALDVLADVRGLASTGRLVVGFDTPRVQTQPFSPFQATKAGIEATVRVLADVLSLARKATTHSAILTATSDVEGDTIVRETTAGLHRIVVQRRPGDGRTATLTFLRDVLAEDVHWLIDPPGPLTFRWDDLANEARLVGADGAAAPPFTAIDVEAGSPKRITLRLLRTRTGPAPAWHVAAKEGKLPAGLRIEVGPEVQTSPEVGESAIHVIFEAQRGKPVEAQGLLVLTAEGLDTPVTLAYEVRVLAGHVLLEAETVLAALPRAAADKLSTLRLNATNGNVPATLALHATCDGGQERWLRAILSTPSGGSVTRWDLTQPLLLPVGDERQVAFELDADAPAELVWPCKVVVSLAPMEGIEMEGGAVFSVRKRRPHIRLGGPPPTFRLENQTLHSNTPLILQLDPDGGDGEWLLALTRTAPSLRSRGGKVGWQAVTRGPGIWHVVATGEWSGLDPAIFSDQVDHVDLKITWAHGRDPGTISIPVDVPARWGERGFVLLSLALMALLLLLLIIIYMRTPAVRGTLLYTVDGLDGTVGRLDLSAVGRRTRVIVSDPNGRLTVAHRGDSIAKIRPTRVGGMLEYTDISGSKERRLLVDGVSLRLGRHIIRYIYGRRSTDEVPPTPPPGEDLLGEEFDIESGRIKALGDE